MTLGIKAVFILQ